MKLSNWANTGHSFQRFLPALFHCSVRAASGFWAGRLHRVPGFGGFFPVLLLPEFRRASTKSSPCAVQAVFEAAVPRPIPVTARRTDYQRWEQAMRFENCPENSVATGIGLQMVRGWMKPRHCPVKKKRWIVRHSTRAVGLQWTTPLPCTTCQSETAGKNLPDENTFSG